MAIVWNKVTWYSKLLAVILFVAIFFVGFQLGKEKTEIISNDNATPEKQVEKSVVPISIKKMDLKEENFSGTVPTISGSSALAKEAQKYVEESIALFRTQANTDVPDMKARFGADSPTATYTIDLSATSIKSKKTQSIILSAYTYTGGAHGNSSYKVITADTSSGKILSLSDVVKKEEESAFTSFVQKELNSWRPAGSDASVIFPDEVKNLSFGSFLDWSLDDKNLIIYFDQYEIGPGVLGAVAFPLPLEKIKNFLKLGF